MCRKYKKKEYHDICLHYRVKENLAVSQGMTQGVTTMGLEKEKF